MDEAGGGLGGADRPSRPRVAIVVYGDLDSRSGGFLYDRRLANHLATHGWAVDEVSLPERPPPRSLLTNLAVGLVDRLERCDVVVEDAYCGPSLFLLNRRLDTPVVALVHYLRSAVVDEGIRGRVTRTIEREYLQSADAYVFNSEPTREAVASLCGVDRGSGTDGSSGVGSETSPPLDVVAPPAGDRLGEAPALSGDRLHGEPFRVVAVGNNTGDLREIARSLSELDIRIEDEELVQTEIRSSYGSFGPEDVSTSSRATGLVTLGDGTDVFEVAVAADAPVVDTPLVDAQTAGAIPEQVVLISIERDGRVIQPTDDTVIQADDVVTLIPRDVSESEALSGFLSPENAE